MSSSTAAAQKNTANGFHPERSRVSPHALADFIRAPVSGQLTEVPGLGPATAAILVDHGVDTTHALIGKFLTMKTAGVETVEHMDRFYLWLANLGTPAGFRAGVCHAIAEKCNTFLPGIYNEDVYCLA